MVREEDWGGNFGAERDMEYLLNDIFLKNEMFLCTEHVFGQAFFNLCSAQPQFR